MIDLDARPEVMNIPPAMSLISTSASTSPSFGLPASVRAGDLLLLLDTAQGAGSHPGNVNPVGWTQCVTVTGSAIFARVSLAAKIAVAGDVSTVFTGITGTNIRKTIAVLRGLHGFDTMSSSGATGIVSAGAISTSITSASGNLNQPTLQFVGYLGTNSSGGATVSAAMSPTQDHTITGFGPSPIHLRILEQANRKYSDASITMNDTSDGSFENFCVFTSLVLRYEGFPRWDPP